MRMKFKNSITFEVSHACKQVQNIGLSKIPPHTRPQFDSDTLTILLYICSEMRRFTPTDGYGYSSSYFERSRNYYANSPESESKVNGMFCEISFLSK